MKEDYKKEVKTRIYVFILETYGVMMGRKSESRKAWFFLANRQTILYPVLGFWSLVLCSLNYLTLFLQLW